MDLLGVVLLGNSSVEEVVCSPEVCPVVSLEVGVVFGLEACPVVSLEVEVVFGLEECPGVSLEEVVCGLVSLAVAVVVLYGQNITIEVLLEVNLVGLALGFRILVLLVVVRDLQGLLLAWAVISEETANGF